mgnify:CR=1 FL=1
MCSSDLFQTLEISTQENATVAKEQHVYLMVALAFYRWVFLDCLTCCRAEHSFQSHETPLAIQSTESHVLMRLG